ncbi:MAG: CRISPR-associated helicase Cas3' [Oscillospiraceae bacterium]|nr:CRISPR-associated helicase Cas3' [Oscillospiraceae bacterium]
MSGNSELLQSLIDSETYPAHIRFDDGVPVIQTNTAHCEAVGEIARDILQNVGLGNAGYSAGRIHDGGKLTDEFRKYLVDAVEGRPASRGSVNHTFVGVRYVLNKWHGGFEDYMTITAEHIAFAIGSHHGMFDLVDRDGKSGFEHRLTKDVPYIQKAVERLDSEFSLDMNECMKEATKEITAAYTRLLDKGEENLPFYESLLSRLLLSSVIEGDRRDTAEFMSGTKLPELSPQMKDTWDSCLKRLDDKLGEFKNDTPINKARSEISQKCKDFSSQDTGIYRLNVPTGAGKTLSSLRFALSHASIHNKQRIFYVIPLLAVIEQNAEVIRDVVGDDSLILEHHSNILPDDDKTDDNGINQRELLMQTWNSPIVITTLVQFLNTLFSDKTSCIRRFHSLCNSVIIIDEVQTVPGRLLSLFNHAITFLSEVCNATIVLCSATQPALECANRPLPLSPPEIVPYDSGLWKAFERTKIVNKGTMSIEEISAFGEELLRNKDSLLIVCNKRSEAENIFKSMSVPDVRKFHFSASMCIAHRRDTLKAMEEAKKHGKVLCVSTQAIEAGVDISFQSEIRLQAGMDSIVQAAGRCNRNGESDSPEDVYVVRCKGETLSFLRDIENGKTATESIFEMYPDNCTSDEAIAEYYRRFYSEYPDNAQDGVCKVDGQLTSIYEMLSCNTDFRNEGEATYILNQAQKTAGEYFKVFDDDTTDVVVPYGESKKFIEELYRCPADDWEQIKSLSQKLKPYTISLYGYERSKLEKALTETKCGVLVLSNGWYDEKALGFLSEPTVDSYTV